MKSKILMAVFLSGVVLAAGAAQAEGHQARPDFATLDLNGDGSLTPDELQAQGEARFARADANEDGALSVEELIAAAGQRASDHAAEMVARHDENGDGVLQLDEMPRRGGDRAARMFERVDADGDGALSQDEFETARERHGDRRGHGPKDRG